MAIELTLLAAYQLQPFFHRIRDSDHYQQPEAYSSKPSPQRPRLLLASSNWLFGRDHHRLVIGWRGRAASDLSDVTGSVCQDGRCHRSGCLGDYRLVGKSDTCLFK